MASAGLQLHQVQTKAACYRDEVYVDADVTYENTGLRFAESDYALSPYSANSCACDVIVRSAVGNFIGRIPLFWLKVGQ